MVRREKSNYVIQSVSHALDVLEQFNGKVDEIGVTELSKRLKLHKNNVFRLLATLEARGYIEQNKLSENYRLGITLSCNLGRPLFIKWAYCCSRGRFLKICRRRRKESAYVAIRKGSAIIPLDFVEPATVGARGFVSGHCPAVALHRGGQGPSGVWNRRARLGQDLPERLERYTEKTIVDRDVLRERHEPNRRIRLRDRTRRVRRRRQCGRRADPRLHSLARRHAGGRWPGLPADG